MGARGSLTAIVAGILFARAALVPAKCLAQENSSPQLPPPSVDLAGCTDPKGVPRLAASVIESCDSGDSIEVTMPLKPDAQGVVEEKSVRGFYEFREYRIPPVFQQDQAFQSLTLLFRNVGFTIKYSEIPSTITARNQDTWVLATIGGDYYDVKAVRVPVDPWTPIQSAQEISREMEIHKRAAIYGIEFSPDNQAIVDNHSKIFTEILTYLNGNPRLDIDVESHLTSRNGSAESDQEATRKRAQAVVAWLEAHGIVAARLRPKAFGRSKPITEENDTPLEVRRNERIELAKTAP
jgi:outer membrane protein OmpA-like peptidoglycan-associated protein